MPELYGEVVDANHNKYYRVEWQEHSGLWRSHYGAIGTGGNYQYKQAGNPLAAERAARKLFNTKVRRSGYVQKARPDGAIPFIPPFHDAAEQPEEKKPSPKPKQESTGTAVFGDGGRTLL